MEKLYTIKEVSGYLKLSEGHIRNMISQGKIEIVKVLGSTRITETELKKLIS